MKNILLLSILLLIFNTCIFSQVAIIANKNVQTNLVDKNTLKKLYELGTMEFEGKKVVLFDLKPEDPVKDKFYNFLGTTPANIKKIWLKVTLSGNGVAPIGAGSQEEILQKVSTTPNSIGYISKSLVKDNVKVIGEIP
jgi:hypothetical protein